MYTLLSGQISRSYQLRVSLEQSMGVNVGEIQNLVDETGKLSFKMLC